MLQLYFLCMLALSNYLSQNIAEPDEVTHQAGVPQSHKGMTVTVGAEIGFVSLVIKLLSLPL